MVVECMHCDMDFKAISEKDEPWDRYINEAVARMSSKEATHIRCEFLSQAICIELTIPETRVEELRQMQGIFNVIVLERNEPLTIPPRECILHGTN